MTPTALPGVVHAGPRPYSRSRIVERRLGAWKERSLETDECEHATPWPTHPTAAAGRGRLSLEPPLRLEPPGLDDVREMASFLEGSRRMGPVTPSYADLERIHGDLNANAGGSARLRCRRRMMLAVYDKATRPPARLTTV